MNTSDLKTESTHGAKRQQKQAKKSQTLIIEEVLEIDRQMIKHRINQT